MVTIQIDEQTAQTIKRQAMDAGLSVEEYLRDLVSAPAPSVRPTWDEIEKQFMALSTDGPSLPAGFSRADIYDDHD